MQASTCPRCGQLLFFDNSVCLGCGAALGFVPERLELVLIGPGRRRCLNATIAACNWLVDDDDPEPLCLSCRLTRTRPNDADLSAMQAFRLAEAAKRRLLAQVLGLGLPIAGRAADPEAGLAFDLLSSRNQDVMTGHDDGVITLDLSESDAVHRECVRLQMGEPYRTVLGHLRHEIGHYYWPSSSTARRPTRASSARCSATSGSPTTPRSSATTRRTARRTGPDVTCSAYATMHPWEDWAETFAHYLHIEAGIATAASFGMRVGEPSLAAARRSMGSGAPAG